MKEAKKLKLNYSKYYKINIIFDDSTLNLTAFLDTGNKLTDPITNKPIILVEKDLIILKNPNNILGFF